MPLKEVFMYESTLIKDMIVFKIVTLTMVAIIMLKIITVAHPDNSMPVNTLVTPAHIVPEWYFLAYYNTLKIVPSKEAGILVFMSTVLQEIVTNITFIIYSKIVMIFLGSQLTTPLILNTGRIIIIINILTKTNIL